MRILQVVTYISPDGAYGGPVRVAVNQAKALTKMGHEVVLAAAAGGFTDPLPTEFDGFPVHLFAAQRIMPKSGFAGLTSPGLLSWLTKVVRTADVVHVHLARDLVTLPSAVLALLAGKPLLVQTHGMIDKSRKALAAPLDRLLTRPVLNAADRVFYLTDREREDLISVAGESLALAHLPNGVTVPGIRAIEQEKGPQACPEVLFLARLHARKRPLLFTNASVDLATRWPQVRFSLVGPDEGEGAKVGAAIAMTNHYAHIQWFGPVEPDLTLERMEIASIYALTSVDEPFPMSVLEALSIGLPVIVTETCGLASRIKEWDAGIVCDSTQDSFMKAIEYLLENPDRRIEMGTNGRNAVGSHLNADSVGSTLDEIYQNLHACESM